MSHRCRTQLPTARSVQAVGSLWCSAAPRPGRTSARNFGAARRFPPVAARVPANRPRYDRRRFRISIDQRGSGIYRMIEAIAYSAVIGIDPGASGGIAWRIQNEPIQALAMPATDDDQIELIRQ